jgi:hypothetical protein
MNPQEVSELVARSKRETEQASAQLLKTFEFVPEDRQTWSPSPTARTALRIVAHCGAANFAFAALLRGDGWGLSMDPQEAMAQIRSSGSDVSTREGAVESVRESTAAVLAALDGATPERVESAAPTPFGPFPYTLCMAFPADHMSGHARQIDYLQTIWGDEEDHRI